MVMRVSEERVMSVASAIRLAGVDGLLRLEEQLDPQYDYMQRLADSVGRGPASAYALLVALVSYRLTMRGEEWWKCVSEMLGSRGRPRSVDEIVDNVVWFLNSCSGSLVARDAKVRRVRRAGSALRGLLDEIARNPGAVMRRPQELLRDIAFSLGSSEERKTITFSVKMAYYAARPRGQLVPLGFNIPMPVDVRVACVSLTSGVVSGVADYHDLVRSPREVQRAWEEVSQLSGVPTPHLDSLLWVVGWAPRDLGQQEARMKVRDVLSAVMSPEAADAIAAELTYMPCRPAY